MGGGPGWIGSMVIRICVTHSDVLTTWDAHLFFCPWGVLPSKCLHLGVVFPRQAS